MTTRKRCLLKSYIVDMGFIVIGCIATGVPLCIAWNEGFAAGWGVWLKSLTVWSLLCFVVLTVFVFFIGDEEYSHNEDYPGMTVIYPEWKIGKNLRMPGYVG